MTGTATRRLLRNGVAQKNCASRPLVRSMRASVRVMRTWRYWQLASLASPRAASAARSASSAVLPAAMAASCEDSKCCAISARTCAAESAESWRVARASQGARAVTLADMFCLPQNDGNSFGNCAPFGAIIREQSAAGFCDAVVAARAIVFGALVGFNAAGGFEFVERGVGGAFFEVEDAFGAGFDGLGDGVAVGRALGEGFEDQGGERAFEIHRYLGLLCIG